MTTSYRKRLTANDTGETGGHQAGICVPRDDDALLSFFPTLDPAVFNPDAWLLCEDDSGVEWRMRYIYYNGRLHGRNTRNEYRITHMTKYLRRWGAKVGDSIVFTNKSTPFHYGIRLEREADSMSAEEDPLPGLIILRGWKRVF
ncbi:EcoRII N-terminal effector-binding domain-containing protein [Actomonas aquatica]|uniref:EcoRII N-terminal effector-binding domain-containing protein n=1 Tax=Actomonas aquatica TaxID=2866162 RepID=UPI001C7F3935